MKEYKYPDKDDLLTCSLIENNYDGNYWESSEIAVLKYMVNEINKMKSEPKDRNMLDVGCGMGRLFEIFSGCVGKITGTEPDIERFHSACIAADVCNEATVRNADRAEVRVIHGTIDEITEDNYFDVILSSHVLQHITHETCESLFADMSAKLRRGGLLILTTTCTAGQTDLFFKESWKNNCRFAEEIDAFEFKKTFEKEDILPVRIFAEATIKALAVTNGLEIVKHGGYHYSGHNTPQDDVEANRCGDIKNARDSFWILKKPEFTLDGNVCYQFSFSILDDKTGLRDNDENELRKAVKDAYPEAVFEDDDNVRNESIFHDIKTAEEFLHGGGLPFGNFRVLLKNYRLKFKNFKTAESAVLLTVFPESDNVQVCIFVGVKDVTPDDMVYIRHVQGNGVKLLNSDGRELSVHDVFLEISECLHRCVTDIEETYLLEIKRFGQAENVTEIIENNACMIYGMMCGDEGWRNVPEELAMQRLENQWGSRNFMRLAAFGANFIFFNMNTGKTADIYFENRQRFDHSYYGDVNPYFLIDSDYAGINHGILFSIELVMTIKTTCSRILRRQADYYKAHSKSLSQDIRKTKAYRGQLLTTLNKIESLSISEIGELERVILNSQQIDPIIDKVKYLLELLESELDLLYQNSTNRLVNILTVAGLILAALQIVLQ